MQRDGRRGLEQLAADGAEDPHVEAAAGGGRRHDAVVGVDHLHELADLERRRPAPLHLLGPAELLAPEVPELVLDVVLLDLQELVVAPERLVVTVEVAVVALGGRRGGGEGRRVRRRGRHREGRGGRGRGHGGCRHRTRMRRVRVSAVSRVPDAARAIAAGGIYGFRIGSAESEARVEGNKELL